MNTAKRACGLMLILSAACMMVTGYLLLNASADKAVFLFLPAAPLYAVLVWALNLFLLKKERSVTLLFLVGTAAAIVYLVPCYLIGIMSGAVNTILALAMAITPAALSPCFNITPPKLSQCILMLEGALVLLLLDGLILPYRDSSAGIYVWGILSVCTSMLCLLLYRMEGTVTLRTVLLLAGLFAVLAVVVSLFLWGGAAAAGGGLVSLWQGIAGAAAKLWRLIEAFMQRVASLFHTETLDEVDGSSVDIGVVTQAADDTGEAADVKLGFLAILILIVLVAAVIFVVLRLFGKTTVGGAAQQKKAVRHHSSLGDLLRARLRAFRIRLTVNRWLRQNRDNPVGIFYLMEKKCRRSGLARKTEDTPADFLRRLAQALDPEYADTALSLIPAVNRSIFAGNAEKDHVPHSRELLRKVNAAARKNRLQHQKSEN